MNGKFNLEEAKCCTEEEYLHYYSCGLAPPPPVDIFERWVQALLTERQDLEDRIDELLEKCERLTREPR
jgi:hypothetical protein